MLYKYDMCKHKQKGSKHIVWIRGGGGAIILKETHTLRHSQKTLPLQWDHFGQNTYP